jgi:hypothetical protein
VLLSGAVVATSLRLAAAGMLARRDATKLAGPKAAPRRLGVLRCGCSRSALRPHDFDHLRSLVVDLTIIGHDGNDP